MEHQHGLFMDGRETHHSALLALGGDATSYLYDKSRHQSFRHMYQYESFFMLRLCPAFFEAARDQPYTYARPLQIPTNCMGSPAGQ